MSFGPVPRGGSLEGHSEYSLCRISSMATFKWLDRKEVKGGAKTKMRIGGLHSCAGIADIL